MATIEHNDDSSSHQKVTLPQQIQQSAPPTKTKPTSSSKLLLGAKGNHYSSSSNNNNNEEEESERRNSEDEADEYEYQEYKRARKLKKQQKQEAKELKAAEKQREKQKKKDRKKALKKAKAGGRRVSVSSSPTSTSRRGSQSSESYNRGHGTSSGRLGLGIVGVGGRGGEEQEVCGEVASQGFSTGRRESLGGGSGVVVKKRSRVATLFLRKKKPETTHLATSATAAYALITKAAEEEGEGIALQPLERGQGLSQVYTQEERERDHHPPQGAVDNLSSSSSSPFAFSSASVTPSGSKPHRLDLSFGKNKGGKGGYVAVETSMKSPSSPHGGGRCYLRRVWSKIKHPHRNSNSSKSGMTMVPKKLLAAQE